MTNENITPSDWTRSDNNEPVQPQLDPGVINITIRLKNNKAQYKTNVLVPTDTTNDEIENPQVTTIIPPLVKVEDDIALTDDDDVDFRVDIAHSDDDVTYVKYIPPPPEIPVPPPVHPRNR